MGIQVAVEDENGTTIATLEDATNILHRILPEHDDRSFHWLNRIDWYGDTTFNRLQIPEVRRELQRLSNQQQKGAEELELVNQIDALAAKVQSEPHLYLKFYGD